MQEWDAGHTCSGDCGYQKSGMAFPWKVALLKSTCEQCFVSAVPC